MIDTHCHLTDPRLFDQLEEVISRAASAGVPEIITIGVDLFDAQNALSVCRAHVNVRCAVGIHPNHSADAFPADVEQLRALLANDSVVALGEIGLDYHHHFAPVPHQRLMFETQLQLARELNMPVVLHCREAISDTLDVLRDFGDIRAVFHSFTGTYEEAKQILDGGYLLGFTGPITFKKNDALRDVVRMTPADRMLMETDAPYLTPEPMRKIKTNEPAFVIHTSRMAADLKGLEEEDFGRLIAQTAHRFFRYSR